MRVSRFAAVVVVVSVVAISSAVAGPDEDSRKEEETGKVDAALKEIKSECGCALKLTVDWKSFPSAGEMQRIGEAAGYFRDAAVETCKSSAGSRARVCGWAKKTRVKITFRKGEEPGDFKKGLCYVEENNSCLAVANKVKEL